MLGLACELPGRDAEAADHLAELRCRHPEAGHRLEGWDYAKARRGPDARIEADGHRTLASAIEAARLEGLVLEFGLRFGTSIRFIAERAGQEVHGFDSFEALPEAWGRSPAGFYSADGRRPEVPANARPHAGWFEDTLPGFFAAHPGSAR